MKGHHLSLFFILTLFVSSITKTISTSSKTSIQRRILHQPLFPANSAPPPGTESPPPPPPDTPFPNPDQPFFPEVPAGAGQDQTNQPPPASTTTNGSIPIPTATQPAKPAKKVAIAISVGIVTLGMLSALAFFLYRHRAKHPTESQKLVGPNSQQRLHQDESGVPPSSFLYIGTVEPSRRSVSEANGSPYHKLNSVKRSSDRYRPSPELQPLPQLTKPPSPQPHNVNSPVATSSSDEESHDTAFYTPQCSSISTDDYCTPATASRPVNVYSNGNNNNVPHSKRTSPRSRLMAASPEMKHVIIPPIKQNQPPPLPPQVVDDSPQPVSYSPKRPKFSSPPPPPNMELLRSLNSNPSEKTTIPVPPPPPPPPPMPKRVGSSERSVSSVATTPVLLKPKSWSSSPKFSSGSGKSTKSAVEEAERSAGCSEKTEGDSLDGTKPKLKALHWDKVRATSDRATVWDQLKSSSFQ